MPPRTIFVCSTNYYDWSRADWLTCGNIAGEKTGPVSGQPPALSAEATDAIVAASEKDPKGTNVPGQDGGDSEGPKKAKTEKERTLHSTIHFHLTRAVADDLFFQSLKNAPKPRKRPSSQQSKQSKRIAVPTRQQSPKRRSQRRRRRHSPHTLRRRPRERRRSSSLWMMLTTRPTFLLSSSPRGTIGGRRRSSTNPNLAQMAR